MSPSLVERRLAAIIAMDVVGYSRLMGIDEIATVTALKAHRKELIDPVVKTSGGRVVKTTGDGLLLEFASIVDAIGCAVAIQRGMLARNAHVPQDEQIVFRIGVNIGDIIIDGDDILGDGVNVAARLEALCEPGGVYISRAANEQVRDKLRLSFADLGEHTVKNIARAIGVFGLAAKDIAALPEPKIHESDAEPTVVLAPIEPAPSSGWYSSRILAAGLASAVAVAIGVWWVFQNSVMLTPPKTSVATVSPLPANTAATTPVTAPRLSPADTFRANLSAVMQDIAPAMSDRVRQSEAGLYHAAISHKAIVVRPPADSWRTSDWPDETVAEQSTLEACQTRHGEPCIVAAVDDKIQDKPPGGYWRTRPMTRVAYNGVFEPQQIPIVRDATRQRQDVAGYKKSSGAKAVAIHPWGRIFVATGAASQHAAETAALADCNSDPSRKGQDGPCLLYAVADQVVLPKRSTAPLSPLVSTPPPASIVAATPSDKPRQSPADVFRAALSAVIEDAAPAIPENSLKSQVGLYHSATGHKAVAVHSPSSSWRTSDWPDAAAAELNVLEACQMRFGDPCNVVVIDDKIQQKPSDGKWRNRAMPRVAYDGAFDPLQIPLLRDVTRQRQDIADYKSSGGPKAVAIHPWGRIFISTGAVSQHAAETVALADCNNDPSRKGEDGPCFLYAVADQVVLTKRLKLPMSAPPTAR